MSWDEEKRKQAIDLYTGKNPTPENSLELVTEISAIVDETPNSVRMILSKAKVYKKSAPKTSKTDSNGEDKPKRQSRDDMIAELVSAMKDAGQTADTDIVGKFTGKAALYFAGVIRSITNNQE